MSRLLLALLLCASAASAERGASGTNFLRAMTSPRAAGMGETGVGLADDVLTATALNPAGLGRLNYSEAAFTYSQWYQNISLQHAAFAHPTPKHGTFALSGTMLRSDPIGGYDNTGAVANSVNVRDYAFASSYALKLAGPAERRGLGLFAAAGVKYTHSELDVVSANTFLADLGILYAKSVGLGTIGAGASIMSLGQGQRFDTQREIAPTLYRVGASYSHPVLGDPLTVAWDTKKSADEKFTHGLGFEYAVKRVLFWRMGYVTNQDMGNGFRLGVGFKLKVLTIDYALSNVGSFGFTHLIGLSMRFGEPIDRLPVLTPKEETALKHILKGKSLMSLGRLYDAALEFNEALRLDPHNKEAIRLLKTVRDSLEKAR